MASRLYNAFAAATGVWALLLVLAPFLASRPHASAFGTGLVVAVYAAGSIVCHQLPARSFHLWTAQMPVCARCTGIYFGALVAVIGARAFHPSTHAPGFRSECPEALEGRASASPARSAESLALRKTRVTLALAVAPTLATLAFEWATGRTPANGIRFAAGIPIGVAVAWLVRSAAENQVN